MSLVYFPSKSSPQKMSFGMPRNLMMGCFLGNAIEWFDFAIYGYLANTLGQLFFPNLDPFAALLSSYSVFAAAFIMRPIGAILFGHLGDRWGRRKALEWSLGSMAVPTFIIGLLPVYEQVGTYAPMALIFCRLLQGLSVGGEFSGSVILLAEHAPPHRKGFFATWADMGSSVGMIMASLTILIMNTCLSEKEFLDWGWRLPFIASFFCALVGYRIRSQMAETPEFLMERKLKTPHPWPLRILFQKYKRRLFLSIGYLMVNSAGYYLLIVFIPNQNLNNAPKIYASFETLFSLIIMMPAMIWGAIASDKIGQVRCLILGYSGCLFFAYPLLYFAQYGTFTSQLIWQGLFAMSLGFCFAPRSSLIAQIFPISIRFSAMAISYSIGNALFGGTAPLVCALMSERSGSVLAPAFYIIGAALFSIVCVLFLGRDLLKSKYAHFSIKKLDQSDMFDYKIHNLQKSGRL